MSRGDVCQWTCHKMSGDRRPHPAKRTLGWPVGVRCLLVCFGKVLSVKVCSADVFMVRWRNEIGHDLRILSRHVIFGESAIGVNHAGNFVSLCYAVDWVSSIRVVVVRDYLQVPPSVAM